MNVLVREKAADRDRGIGLEENSLREAAVIALVVLESKVGDMIAERQEKMIIAVMARAEKRARFGDKILQSLFNFRAHVEVGRIVSSEIDFMVNFLARRSQVDVAIVFAGNDRRIHEFFERDRGKRRLISRLALDLLRRTEFPSIGKNKFRRDHDFVDGRTCWVKNGLVPLKHDQLVGGRERPSVNSAAARLEVVVFRFDPIRARWHVEVKREDVGQVAAPWNRLPVRSELQPRQIDDRSARRVLAGNPFRVVKRQRARLDRNHLRARDELLRRFRSVNGERNRARLRENCARCKRNGKHEAEQGKKQAGALGIHSKRLPGCRFRIAYRIARRIIPRDSADVQAVAVRTSLYPLWFWVALL